MTDSQALDINVITTLKGLMKDRFSFLIETFINKTNTQLQELEQAINDNNLDVIVSVTHGLKGSAGSVGAQSMHLLCKDYETRARAGELSDVNIWVQTLKTEYELYKNEVQSHL